MKFHFKFTNTDTGKVTELDGGRTAIWDALDQGATWPERGSNEQRTDFAWGYHAAKRAKALDELGVEGMTDDEAVDYIADNYDLLISDNPVPLPDAPRE